MKRLFLILICLVMLLMTLSSSAAVEYLMLEELQQVEGPATVHVVARTKEPTGLSGGYHTSKTRWQWEIKTSDGSFVPVYYYVNMDWYGAMSTGERSFVLNHKECDLTIEVSANGGWKGIKISAVSKPLSAEDIGPILLFTVAFAVVLVLFMLYSDRQNNPGARSQDKYIKKTQLLAVNGIQYTTHKGIVGNAILGHMVAGDIGAIIGALSSEQVHSDNEFTFLVYYNGGRYGKKKVVEKVRQSNARFKVLAEKLEDDCIVVNRKQL